MNHIPFHATPMGRAFYERTFPALVRELLRLNERLERLAAAVEDRENPDAKKESNP